MTDAAPQTAAGVVAFDFARLPPSLQVIFHNLTLGTRLARRIFNTISLGESEAHGAIPRTLRDLQLIHDIIRETNFDPILPVWSTLANVAERLGQTDAVEKALKLKSPPSACGAALWFLELFYAELWSDGEHQPKDSPEE